MATLSGSWIRKAKRLAIYLRDGFTCVYCRRDLHCADPFDITLDHITPRSTGGSNEATNLVTACRSCNSRRQAKSVRRFASAEAKERIRRQRRRALPLAYAKALILGTARNRKLEGKR